MAETALDFNVRKYRPGDEIALVRLFNSENATLAGFVPRTVEYWRWSCLERPDVDEEGIMIIEKADKIVGYSVVGKSGNVWELCYDSHNDAETILSGLLDQTLNYARSVGGNSVVLNVSTLDSLLRKICGEFDFAESRSEPMFISVLDLPRLMCTILQSRSLSSDMNGVFWFCLKGCPPWCVPNFGVRLEGKKVAVLSEPRPVSRITIETEMSTLVALIFGTKSVFSELISSRIHVHPFLKIFKARKLLSLLQNKTPWFVPRADMG